MVDVSKKTWLADLVEQTLRGHDPTSALLRIPPELRGADPDGPGLEARARTLLVRSLRQPFPAPADGGGPGAADADFLGPVAGHLELALEIALVHGVPFDRERRRAELATFLAALVGDLDALRTLDPSRPGGGAAATVRKALVRAGAELKAGGYPAGDQRDGLPLRLGVTCLQRRHLARAAIAYHGEGGLDLATARRLLDEERQGTLLLVEALAGVASAAAPLDARRRRRILDQVARLRLPSDLARLARTCVRVPRGGAALARVVPERGRAFLLEQLMVAVLTAPQPHPAQEAYVAAFAAEAGTPPEQVAALRSAAALHAGQQRWVDPADRLALGPLNVEEWEQLADRMVDRAATALTENLEAIVTEIRETGELGQLLAKAAAGNALSDAEREKVKAQLIDLAKAVPALAIFAAPGGMLLLPLLAKLLPFNLLPSAWEQKDVAAPLPPPPTPPKDEGAGS